MIPYPYVLRRRMMMQGTVALPPTGRGFANYTWAELDAISKAGLAADYFTVGETRNINLSYAVDGTDYSGTYELAIHGINHDELADGSGKAGLTVGFNTLLGGYRVLHPTNTEGISWSNCDMRTTYLPNVLATLPADLRAVIKTVNKGSTNGVSNTTSGGGAYVVVQDQVFLPCDDEVVGSIYEMGSDSEDLIGGIVGGLAGYILEGRQYEYFKDTSGSGDGDAEDKIIKYDTSGVAQRWRTRSITTTTNNSGVKSMKGGYIDVDASTGTTNVDAASWTHVDDSNISEKIEMYYYIAPLFCI